jgi:hypothetical protein
MFMISWVALALPWMDLFIGTHLFSYFKAGAFPSTFVTWFGEFSGKNGDYYFMTVFISIPGVKGYWVLKRMADILMNDYLVVNKLGQWGGRKDFAQ